MTPLPNIENKQTINIHLKDVFKKHNKWYSLSPLKRFCLYQIDSESLVVLLKPGIQVNPTQITLSYENIISIGTYLLGFEKYGYKTLHFTEKIYSQVNQSAFKLRSYQYFYNQPESGSIYKTFQNFKLNDFDSNVWFPAVISSLKNKDNVLVTKLIHMNNITLPIGRKNDVTTIKI